MILRKISEHGLGHLLNPLNPEDVSTDWIKELWIIIVLQAEGVHVRWPEWLTRPAVSRETASSPMLLNRLVPKRRKPLSYAERIKPMNFLLAAHVAPFGYPEEVDPTKFRLIAPYTRDASKWLHMPWTDVHSGNTYRITTEQNADSRLVRVKSYGDVFSEYLTHPEPKSAGPDGAPCSRSTVGLLQRQPVIGTRVIYTGKESNRLEDVESGNIGLWDEIRATYADPRTFRRYVIPILKIISCSELMERTGCSERHVKAIRNGYRKPSGKIKPILAKIAAEFARKFMREPVADEMDACAAFVSSRGLFLSVNGQPTPRVSAWRVPGTGWWGNQRARCRAGST